jgi:uncharacterized protein Veg
MKAAFIHVFTFWIVNNMKCVKKEGKREDGKEMELTREKERKVRRKRHTRLKKSVMSKLHIVAPGIFWKIL